MVRVQRLAGDMSSSRRLVRRQWVSIVALLVVATVIRLIELGDGLWYDEILTWLSYGEMPFLQIVTTYDSQNQHILFSLLSRLSLTVFGSTPWALRLPAVVFGVAGIGALWLLGRDVSIHEPADGCEAVRVRAEPLLAAAFLTFSYHHVWFSQNARGYTGLLFWSLLSTWFFLRALRAGRALDWAGFAMCIAMGVYTHLTMLFVVAGQFLAFGLAPVTQEGPQVERPDAGSATSARWWFRGLVYGFGLAGLLTLLLYGPVLGQLFGGLTGEEGAVAVWKNPLWTLLEFAREMRVGLSGVVIAIFALLPFALGLVSTWRRAPSLVIVVLVPPVLGTLVMLTMDHYLWPRFYFFAFGFCVLIMITGAFELAVLGGRVLKWSSWRANRAGVALSLLLVLASATTVPTAYGPKQDFHGAFDYVAAQRRPNDAVVTVGLTTLPFERWIGADFLSAENGAELDAIRASAERTWLLYTLPLHLEAEYPEIAKRLEHDFEVIRRFHGTLNGGDIVVCRYDHSSK